MATEKTNIPIDTILKEGRSFPPPKEFAQQAFLKDPNTVDNLRESSQKDPVGFWEMQAREQITWSKSWDKALEWNAPFAKWFLGGQLNASVNCLDRHLPEKANKTALIWEGEDGTVKQLTFGELHTEVCKLASGMQAQGLKPGDTAAIYMPLTLEAVVTMLACARIGVTHSVIFAGFAANAIRDRVIDAECKTVFTTDIAYRKGQKLNLLKIVEDAVKQTPQVDKVFVHQREKGRKLDAPFKDWDSLKDGQLADHTPEAFDSEHPLFILYTSGTTGSPKGIMHSTGGYLTGAITTAKWVFDLKDDDVYWCTADIGWITGHSYVVYGILGNGNTCLLYEGAPMHPHPGRFWEIIDKHKVSILYTAPTAIRAFMRMGDEHVTKHKLDSLRLLGTVGEPINPEAWMWYHTLIGKKRCPIVDTWWQTETGSIMISPLPGTTTTHPGSATRPFPGIVADVVNESGESCQANEGGLLVIKHPWPSMLRGIKGDAERFQKTYWSQFSGIYFTGDGAHRDADGNFWIKGRVDDVLNVSGHRLGTMEIESALVSSPLVVEAAVVGRPDDIKGQAVVAFVTPKASETLENIEAAKSALKKHVGDEIGAIARPDEIFFTKALPKTRSGKIMRRLLRDIAEGKEVTGDTTTLENPGLVELIE